MPYLIALFFGLIPSIIWLLFYLRKDSHPESNGMIMKIFLIGAAVALPAAFIEMGIFRALPQTAGVDILNENWSSHFPFWFLFYNFLGIAFIEEIIKYLVVREKILKNAAFDEPADAMLYMIIAALGFAALENILVLFPREGGFTLSDTITISAFRFLGATFLHALCSGLVGYFLALSICKTKKHISLMVFGLLCAAFLHGLYNIYIIKTGENSAWIVIPIIILAGLAAFVSSRFQKVKKLSSTCQIK